MNGNRLYSEDTYSHPQYIGKRAEVKDSLINQGAVILGKVDHSVVSNEVTVEAGAVVKNSVLMTGARVCKGAKISNCLLAPDAYVGENVIIEPKGDKIELISGKKVM